MNFFESNKLAKMVLEWWEENKGARVSTTEYECDVWDEEPEFVKQARIVLECE